MPSLCAPRFSPTAIAQSPPTSSPASRQAEADTLSKRGIEQINTSRYREALASFQAALEIYQELGDRNSEALTLMNLGVAYRSLSDYQQAIAYYQKALPIFQQTGDRNS
jgi:tetratricopeptide (TPR) repeat protein